MKKLSIPLVIATSLLLLIVVVFSVMGFPYSWVFCTTVIGQTLLVFTVYKVLTDNYTTDKTFDDFYEDAPIDYQ